MDNLLEKALLNISAKIQDDSRLDLINFGGCGVFAIIVAKHFNFTNIIDAYGHFLIEIDVNTVYDSNGLMPKRYICPIKTNISQKDLTRLLRIPSGYWNRTFNRKRLTPLIYSIVKHEANEYKKLISC